MAVATRREQLRAQLLAQRGSARRASGTARAAGVVDSMCSTASPEKVTSTMAMAASGKLGFAASQLDPCEKNDFFDVPQGGTQRSGC